MTVAGLSHSIPAGPAVTRPLVFVNTEDEDAGQPSRTHAVQVVTSEKAAASSTNTTKHPHRHFPPWLIICVWISVSSTVIFYNAAMLKEWHFPYPTTLTTLHLAFQTAATQILARFTTWVPSPTSRNQDEYTPLPVSTPNLGASQLGVTKWSSTHDSHSNPQTADTPRLRGATSSSDAQSTTPSTAVNAKGRPQIDSDLYWKRVVPIGLLFSVSLVLSNAVYLYLSVSFIQMVKSASPVAVLVTSVAWGLRPPSLRLLAIVLIISGGICISSYGEAAFDAFGFSLQVLAIVVEANRVVMIQTVLQAGMAPLTSLYFFAPVCLVINATLILPLEGWQAIYAIRDLGLPIIISNAAFTFLLNLSAVYLIQLSPLVLSLSKVLKDLILIFASNLFLGSPITLLQGCGYLVALGGLVAYKQAST